MLAGAMQVTDASKVSLCPGASGSGGWDIARELRVSS